MIDTKPFLGAITLGVAGYGLNKIYGKNSGMNSLLDIQKRLQDFHDNVIENYKANYYFHDFCYENDGLSRDAVEFNFDISTFAGAQDFLEDIQANLDDENTTELTKMLIFFIESCDDDLGKFFQICEVCDELNADEILENFTEKLGEIADDIDDIISRSNSDELEKSEVEFVSDVLKLFNEC
ncbi:MAG: hypothetical protein ACTTIV_03650 [Campylobacter sp.]